ncbi:MAG: type II CRISPR RNA-guided endonuclease Cas9 [Nitrospira sp.]|nr:type II CRISPR RNA-guided endonuclease Cas9 [Nitrospira sp.]
MSVKHYLPYTLGLDIGMASVGWCLLTEDDILAMGVRAFDKAEAPDGAALNAIRREKRLMRRRLRRRAHRLLRARRLFRREGLIPGSDSAHLAMGSDAGSTPWELRARGLEERLSPGDWARALYHLVKFRGFHSTRKSEIQNDEEAGRMLIGVSQNQALLDEGGYRTPAELACHHERFARHKRNKAGSYTQTFSRKALSNELALLFAAQRQLGNPHASEDFEAEVASLLWSQRPPLTGADMLKLLGSCTFEPGEYRAPKRCYSAERFVWLSKLNNLKLFDDGAWRPLNESERSILRELPFSGKTEKITYKTLRRELQQRAGLAATARFAGLSYRPDSAKNPEDAIFFSASGWHGLRRAYDKAGLEQAWLRLCGETERLDAIGYALSVLKTDQEIQDHLQAAGLSDTEIAALLAVGFKDFINLSLKAIRKLLPGLEQGQRYDQVATEVYGHHSARVETAKARKLPPLDKATLRNPVVFRALNQARKVVNAIIDDYGAPVRVHIELARDLTRPFEERRQIEKGQHQYRDQKLEDIARFEETFGFTPRSQDLLKWRLYREQDGQCAYSLKPLAEGGDCRTIFDGTRTQIDHILPWSRSFDDGYNNKVLVLTSENQDKANQTPYEFLRGESDSEHWRLFEAWVRGNKKFREAKRQRLLRKHFDATESNDFMERNLTDTRYICRYFKNLLEQHLQLAETSEARRCVVVNGQLTGFLRARWGLIKERQAGDLHHALDAAVIAACGHALVKHLGDYARRGELERVRSGYVDVVTGEVIDIKRLRTLESRFPEPFPHFREKLLDRLSPAPARGDPLLVSRAPTRRASGAAHQETIRSAKRMGRQGVSTVKTPLTRLKLADLARLAGREDPRNHALYQAIEERLKRHNGNGVKAFGPDLPPLIKPSREGVGPIVRTVKLEDTQRSGLPIRGGIANNDSMLRVDIFRKAGKHFVVPVYVADLTRRELPCRAVVAHKPETEWEVIDDRHEFLLSLYPNDFVCLKFKGKPDVAGYYAGCDRAGGTIHILAHDRNQSVGKEGLIRGIGVKTALSITKCHVDVLGRRYPVLSEVRRDLAQHRR